MTKRIVLITFVAVSIWIFLAPFAVGYQPQGRRWDTATRDDVIAGATLLVVSLVALAGDVALSIRQHLRRARATAQATPSPPGLDAP